MAKAYVADGDGCLVVEAASLEAAQKAAQRIAAERRRETDEERTLGAEIDQAFDAGMADPWPA